MVTATTSKKSRNFLPPFQEWSGVVLRKITENNWQPNFIKIRKSALNCFINETDEIPTTVFTLQAFDIIAQHEDSEENKENVLTLNNGPAQVKISWKNFKEYNYVLDGLSSHGVTIKNVDQTSKKKQKLKKNS